MEKENLNQAETINSKIAADDLKFMRKVAEKIDPPGAPDWWCSSVIIMFGLICLVGYISVHYLIWTQYHNWIWPIYYSLAGIGACYSFIGLFFSIRNDEKTGFISRSSMQAIWIWVIALANGFIWSLLGHCFNNFIGGDPGFVIAMMFCIALAATGILDSHDSIVWYLGSILIFTGMALTFFFRSHLYLILGLATGAGLIVPILLLHIIYIGQEKCHE